MILSPPGCSGSHRLTSRTIPSTTNHAPPASLCAVMSAHLRTRTRDACVPSRAAHASAAAKDPTSPPSPPSTRRRGCRTRGARGRATQPPTTPTRGRNRRSPRPRPPSRRRAARPFSGSSPRIARSSPRIARSRPRGNRSSSSSSSTAASSSTADPSPNSDRRAFSHSTRFPLLAAPSGAALANRPRQRDARPEEGSVHGKHLPVVCGHRHRLRRRRLRRLRRAVRVPTRTRTGHARAATHRRPGSIVALGVEKHRRARDDAAETVVAGGDGPRLGGE